MSEPTQPTKTCAICGKPQEHKFRPFCSQRCKDVDLNRWFNGAYAVPVVEDDDIDEAEAARAREDRDT